MQYYPSLLTLSVQVRATQRYLHWLKVENAYHISQTFFIMFLWNMVDIIIFFKSLLKNLVQKYPFTYSFRNYDSKL